MGIKNVTRKRAGAGAVRTTVTLERDVRRRAGAFSKSRGLSFRDGLNELVRMGLLAQSQEASAKPFELKPRRIGLKPGLSYDNIEELLELGEGSLHR